MSTERIHVLVVDDVVDMATSTAELLGLWGYEATACSDGVTALACACNRRPAAVLLDLIMPRMDGFLFATLFRAIPGCEVVPIVAVSGHLALGCRYRAKEVGIGHYLLKPADLGQLKALLGSMTRRTEVPRGPGLELCENNSTSFATISDATERDPALQSASE